MKDRKPIKYAILLDLCPHTLKYILQNVKITLKDKYEYALRIAKSL
jgi:hypothetical protein